jgi:hypothetical protein
MPAIIDRGRPAGADILTGERVALAFHSYQEANGTLPPAIVYDKNDSQHNIADKLDR